MLAGLLAPVGAASAAAPSYVALGDSYSSGTGTRSYLNDGTSCQRSVYAYPSLLAAQKGYALNFRACSGATIPDVTSTQLGALGSGTRYVTLSVGGNDAGFADVLTECATPWWAGDCNGAIDEAQAFINGPLPGKLATLYSSVRSRATTAKVVIVGYPRIFNGEDCNAGTWFSPAEEARLNQTADLLNSKLSAAASARGFSFANPTSRFVGHAVCDDPEWINGLSYPISRELPPQPCRARVRLHAAGQPAAHRRLRQGHPVDVRRGAGAGRRPRGPAAPVRRPGRLDPAAGLPGARPDHPVRPPQGGAGRRRPRPLARPAPLSGPEVPRGAGGGPW